jgi:type IV pilus assembly protein PilQ
VVIDFPRMDVSDIASPMAVDMGPVSEIRVISFDLTMGKLGRLEVLVDEPSEYEVNLDGNRLTLTFANGQAALAVPAGQAVRATLPEVTPVAPGAKARLVNQVDIRDGRIAIETDGQIEKYRYFNLTDPPRLVVDIFDVTPTFSERNMKASAGFDRLRVGTYDDKTRFVLDSGGSQLPAYEVNKADQGLTINWQPGAVSASQPSVRTAAARTNSSPVRASNSPSGPVSVEDIAFEVVGDKSVFTVTLSGPAQVSGRNCATAWVLFGFDNGSIKRSLRRVIDTSAFPSALETVTPYTVNRGNVQDVRFAARLKGDVPYRLQQVGNKLVFEVENRRFAEQVPGPALIELPATTVAPAPGKPAPPAVAGPAAIPAPAPTMLASAQPAPEKRYTGQRISLVFDNADVRNLLQLIAEVSNLNIIAGEEVRGNISIRLIDVPWDQALDVILDIRQLGMMRDGNVVRILPKSKIREMEEADLTAARSRQDLEPLITEVFSISYTNLGNIAGPVRELMTDRGRLTQDERNKKIIVRDIPGVMDDIRGLIAILDTPERQVMIEARIVEASSDFVRDLGVNWGISYSNPGSTFDSFNMGMGGNFLVGIPPAGSASTVPGLGAGIQFGQLGVDRTVIDLRISALESSGRGKIISRPRVTTLNGQEAVITQGTTIPYQTSGADGPRTEFVDAVLELKVIPIINPDNSIIMEIQASNSAPGESFTTADLPGINKKEAKTKVLVFDGTLRLSAAFLSKTIATRKRAYPG